ncbi:hypothetical protein QZH41_018927 [Actinostola sp. cb2023]|nr:hypothetical protein QZH41_018927 [Actinostola sp. cb2023]
MHRRSFEYGSNTEVSVCLCLKSSVFQKRVKWGKNTSSFSQRDLVTKMENNSTAASGPSRAINVGLIDMFLIPAYALIIFVGFGGNALVLVVVKKKRSMHTTTNYLLANLAVADLLTLLWCIPGLVMSFVVHPRGTLGDFLCKFVTVHHVAGITQLVSGLTLTVLAVERYKALFYPLVERLRLTKKNVKYPIACMWVFSIAYVMPLFVIEEYNAEFNACEILWKTNFLVSSVMYWGILALIVFTSFIIILFCYFNIIKGLYFTKTICSRGSAGSSSSAQSGGKDSDSAEKRKIVKLLISVTVVFFVCFIPFCVVSVIIKDARYAIVYKLSYFLVYCSSSINPIIYAFHSSNYREAFDSILLNGADRLHCHLPKKWRNRRSNKMSDFELNATYHHTDSLESQQLKQKAKLLSFKRLEKE